MTDIAGLFSFVTSMVFSVGGDGDALVTCDEWKRLSDAFRSWANESGQTIIWENLKENSIYFQIDTQGGIRFSSLGGDNSYDVSVNIRWPIDWKSE